MFTLHKRTREFFSSFLIAVFLITPLSIFAQEAASEVTHETVEVESPEATGTTLEETNIDPVIGLVAEPTPEEELDVLDKEDQEEPAAEQKISLASEEETEQPKLVEQNIGLDKYSVQSGAFVYPYAITLPRGINGLTPQLQLTYNSNNTNNFSPYASGWEDSIPYIETLNKKGISTMYTDGYYASSLDGELVVKSGNEYIPRVENGSFNKYEKLTDGWRVTTKDGTVYLFGDSTASQQYNPSDTTQVAKWMISNTTDTNGNDITYTYFRDENYLYPETISYADGLFSVEFIREARQDVFKKHNLGFAIERNHRISSIQVKENGGWVYKYDLNYTEADTITHRSHLDTITTSGKDVHGVITTLEPHMFDYRDLGHTWVDDDLYSLPGREGYPQSVAFSLLTQSNGGAGFIDVNGDGLLDFIKVGNNNHRGTPGGSPANPDINAVYINNGSSWDYRPDILVPGVGSISYAPFINYGYVGDINGDGITDFVASKSGAVFGTKECAVHIGNGSGWDVNMDWNLNTIVDSNNRTVCHGLPAAGPGREFQDINGDGLVDYLKMGLDSGGDIAIGAVYLNTGAGWELDSSWTFPQRTNGKFYVGINSLEENTDFLDVNGDGLPDFVNSNDSRWGNGFEQYRDAVFINNGVNGWDLYPNWTFPSETGASGNPYNPINLDKKRHTWGDVNADGLPDYLKINYEGKVNSDDNVVYLGTGSGWEKVRDYVYPQDINGNAIIDVQQGDDFKVFHGDIDGDGLPDFVNLNGTGSPNSFNNGVYISQNQTPLLQEVVTSGGGVIAAEYVPVAQQDASNELHAAQQVVTAVILDDNNGNVWTEVYEYEGGDYYFGSPFDKKQTGFEKITRTNGEGTKTISRFHQHNGETGTELDDSYAKIGREYKTEIYDSNDNLYSRSVTLYDESPINASSSFIFADSTLSQQFDGTSSHTDTAAAYEYDVYGNTTLETNYGLVDGNIDGTFTDTGSDKRRTTRVYQYDPTQYIVGLVLREVVRGNTNAYVQRTLWVYDTLGNLKRERRDVGPADFSVTWFGHDSYGNVLTQKDPLGNITTYNYDSHNLYPETITNAKGQTTSYSYDYSSGQTTSITDPNGIVQYIEYDGFDRPLYEKKSEGAGIITLREYDYDDTTTPRSVHVTNNLSPTLSAESYQYIDGFGRVIQEAISRAGGFIKSDTTYNIAGNVSSQSLPYASTNSTFSHNSPSGLMTSFTYDPLGRTLTETNNIGAVSFEYSGLTTLITDQLNNTKELTTDTFGNLVEVVEFNDGDQYTTSYTYDPVNNLTSITDAEGNIRSMTYDKLSRRLTLSDVHRPSDTTYGVYTYAYDDINLLSLDDPNGEVISYTYDVLNRPLTENASSTPGIDWTFTYDTCGYGIGQLCSTTGINGYQTAYEYDPQGFLSQETRTIDGTNYQTTMTYDWAGNVMSVIHPDSSHTDYQYNNQGLVSQIDHDDVRVTRFEYGPHGNLTKERHENGITTSLFYNSNNMYRLKSRKATKDGVELQKLAYRHNPAGNINRIIDTSAGTTAKTQQFYYDDLYRLTKTTVTNEVNGNDYTREYTYSPIGNIETFDGVAYTYTDNGYNNPHAATTVGTTTLSYDNNGNMTNDGVFSHNWNYNNTLDSSTNGSATSTYLYAHDKSRVKLTEGTETTLYPSDYYEVRDGEVKVNILGPGGVVASVSGTTTEYIHTDHLGSTHLITDETGTIKHQRDYYPFGSARIDAGTSTEDNGYTGYEHDNLTGLNYAEARYHNPVTGRFISQDPIGLYTPEQFLADPQQLNMYTYARNNPVKYIDPTGEEPVDWLDLGLGVITFGFLGGAQEAGEEADPNYASYQGVVQDITNHEGFSKSSGGLAFGVALETLASGGKNVARSLSDAAYGLAHNNHSFLKHVLGYDPKTQRSVIPDLNGLGIKTKTQLADYSESIMRNPSDSFTGTNGKNYFWSDADQVFIVDVPGKPNQSTIFRPDDGVQYYLDQKVKYEAK